MKAQNEQAGFEILFNSMADAAFVCHLNFGKMLGNVLEVNEAFYTLMGAEKDTLGEINPQQFFDKTYEEELDQISGELLERGSSLFNTSFRTANGKYVPVEVNASLFEYAGKLSVIGILRERSARAKVEEHLTEARETLRNLALHLESIREEERRLIARELHDELGQSLTAIKIQMSLLAAKIATDDKGLREKVERLLQLIDESIPSLQKIVQQLRPVILDELGLSAAIDWQMAEFKTSTGIEYELLLPKDECTVAKNISTAVFRILQESLTNVARHSNATQVKVSLNASNNRVSLVVHDNGKGITESQIRSPHSLGILGMRERVLPFAGTFDIKNSMRSGTKIIVSIPLNESTTDTPL